MSANGTSEPNGRAATVRTAVSDGAVGVYTLAQRSLDRVAPPSSRQRAYDSTASFAAERPIVFSFLAAQLALSFLPVVLFLAFALSTVSFAFGAALVFALFWIAVAFMALVPALLVTFSLAVLVWAWALGSFLVARWLYERAPVGVTGALQVDAAGRSLEVGKGEDGVDAKVEKTG